jgi:hypothetical protein
MFGTKKCQKVWWKKNARYDEKHLLPIAKHV